MPHISEAKILILATDGYEQSELEVPRDRLRAAGAKVVIAAPGGGAIRGWKDGDWGDSLESDIALSAVEAAGFDALVLPGGQINPDKLRIEEEAVALVRTFHDAGKVIAAICHGPWMLVEADIVEGRNVTSYKSIRTDLENAGGEWSDRAVVTDKGMITSRSPEDLEAFCAKIIEEVQEGRHERDH